MLGAIIGDTVGSRYIGNAAATKQFDLLTEDNRFTENTLMTLAVAKAFSLRRLKENEAMENDYEGVYEPDVWFSDALKKTLRSFGNRYRNAGQIDMVADLLDDDLPYIYNRFGNFAAYISGCAFAADSLYEALHLVERTASVLHVPSDEVHGAKAIAAVIFLARCRISREYLRLHIEKHYYELPSLDEVRSADEADQYHDDILLALVAFFDSISFEDAVRNAVLLSRGKNTIPAVTGAMAEAFYGISYPLQRKSVRLLPVDLTKILKQYQELFQQPETDKWLADHYGKYEDKVFRKTMSEEPDFYFQTDRYRMIPLHDCDEYDMQEYCEEMFASPDTFEFTPFFKSYLDEILTRFLENWFVIRKSDHRCVGCIDFEKITETGLGCFVMTVQPDEAWEEIFPPLVGFMFEYFHLNKIIAPMNNITQAVKSVYVRIGMKADRETHLYHTQWGDVPMNVYCFDKEEYLKK